MKDYHPSPDLLKRFVCGSADAAECRRVVRHLLSGCPSCRKITRELLPGREAGDRRLPEAVRIVD